jgi:hypothetical protein
MERADNHAARRFASSCFTIVASQVFVLTILPLKSWEMTAVTCSIRGKTHSRAILL